MNKFTAFLCRIGLHRWIVVRSGWGGSMAYHDLVCQRCGKESFDIG